MATTYGVDLVFRSKGQNQLQKFAQGAGKVDAAVKKAQGSTDKLAEAMGVAGGRARDAKGRFISAANGIEKEKERLLQQMLKRDELEQAKKQAEAEYKRIKPSVKSPSRRKK